MVLRTLICILFDFGSYAILISDFYKLFAIRYILYVLIIFHYKICDTEYIFLRGALDYKWTKKCLFSPSYFFLTFVSLKYFKQQIFEDVICYSIL